jgi:acyl carrier protein
MNEQTEATDLLTEQEIKGVQEILCREMDLKPDQLELDAVLDTDLGADSLTKVQIIMALEEKFGVTVPDEISERVETVGDVYEVLAKVLGRQ